jgi:hypothetical protein
MSYLKAFNTKLIDFFTDLSETYPEERDIKYALEAIQGLAKINPKMILDLFYEYVYLKMGEAIKREDEEFVISVAKATVQQQYNEMHASLLIFDKYWPDMTDNNRKAIWNHMKVLVLLCEKAKGL